MTAMHCPAAALKFAAAAEAAGFAVETVATSNSFEVRITADYADGVLVWETQNVAGNSRLGFPVHYVPGVRFSYSNAKVGSTYYTPRSVAEARRVFGIRSL